MQSSTRHQQEQHAHSTSSSPSQSHYTATHPLQQSPVVRQSDMPSKPYSDTAQMLAILISYRSLAAERRQWLEQVALPD